MSSKNTKRNNVEVTEVCLYALDDLEKIATSSRPKIIPDKTSQLGTVSYKYI